MRCTPLQEGRHVAIGYRTFCKIFVQAGCGISRHVTKRGHLARTEKHVGPDRILPFVAGIEKRLLGPHEIVREFVEDRDALERAIALIPQVADANAYFVVWHIDRDKGCLRPIDQPRKSLNPTVAQQRPIVIWVKG